MKQIRPKQITELAQIFGIWHWIITFFIQSYVPKP